MKDMLDKPNTDIGKAIICFQYAERIKSELILAAKMLERIGKLKDNELVGASKLFSFFLDGLQGEVNIAHNVLHMDEFERTGGKVREVADMAHNSQFEEALHKISEAISSVASSGQWALQVLKNSNLL
jgi:hypothetical protein